ncbi:succinylglutamate desuccinylase/aspartoacylase family protein [Aestuariirhabdus sp. Z084]|uniref:succinylglutamate desuccinylase/aspartoacylase family protein n=1 Tax=Aestuariirhabdus haliotis TaxID=2918751 RepID=UPI00201B3B4C|nr:succinylglutamate desuccinylase/aspartoacylase family protein [Aestuariirhabdus haliotis]MCL6417293.1 succinylglutamate desuccinylase/aspartoacylase family protein [Aestuariirhabdus haliotis]MCL6421238.1 succinylglutamate desuccinylase/aspartoacylase family protein [Aestuariirhabdus haliotis]
MPFISSHYSHLSRFSVRILLALLCFSTTATRALADTDAPLGSAGLDKPEATVEAASETKAKPVSAPDGPQQNPPTAKAPTPEPIKDQVQPRAEQDQSFRIMDKEFAPGTRDTVTWPVSINSVEFRVPVVVAHGARKGPVMCMTAALHGDELNGIEIARQVIYGLEPESLAGTVVAVPIVNMEGFMKQQRYMADRRDLNRFFPGNPDGVTPARYAHGLFQNVIVHCDGLIDLHTGSYYRTNLPQLRADLRNDSVAKMVALFGGMTVLQSEGNPGMLRNAAVDAGIPAVTMEVGGPLSLEPEAVEFGVKAIKTFFGELGMTRSFSFWSTPQPVFYESEWVMSDYSGILLARVKLGDKVKENEVIGEVINPVTNSSRDVIAPYPGTVLGMAVNQFVSPGYVIFRIGKQRTEDELREDALKVGDQPRSTSKELDQMADREGESD